MNIYVKVLVWAYIYEYTLNSGNAGSNGTSVLNILAIFQSGCILSLLFTTKKNPSNKCIIIS